MSTLHKVKAYFGMAPMEDYDDDYYDDGDDSRDYAPRGERFSEDVFDRAAGRGEGRYDDRFEDRDYDDAPGGYRGGYEDEGRYRGREFERPREFERSRFSSLRGGGSTRGALAMDPRRMAQMFDESSPLSKITTLRPKDYSEARTIGERFRGGTPVIMDLVSMDNADAKRLVDFAAGLAFALRGSFDKVATKVFLLSPADVDVSPEERRRIAETGFYAYR
ncbi:cell division protein SepF [[Mycobacterium] vasticus]|uniref:Cell division protein SepF n=1 Tax=[Mycobacterium] vasticus TaxID=2875777 RepID=A0ABU5Z0W3_9MYCO|nr:cell division protein SepF [Mycolicibacter sp. MYC017]MEB3071031.1 cell division protein SepF [Mycolicibacter sp. MYC017]